MNASLYGVKYVIGHHLLGKAPPLIRGLVLTNRCNLRCRHCRVIDRNRSDLGFEEVAAAVDAYYREGGRCLYLEGGEPFLWRDGPRDLDHIVHYAHARGYLTVVVYTNGTFPMHTSADTVFVSIDGLQATHDALRGESFGRIMRNIRDCAHTSLFVNYTINRLNMNEIRDFCEYVHGIERIRGIFFYLHTPYYGRDDLYLEPEVRHRILHELLLLRKHYRILNSKAGLQSALRNDWKRPVAACSVYEKGVVYACCRYSDDPALCRDCGYLNYAEIDQVLKMKPSAIYNALQYF